MHSPAGTYIYLSGNARLACHSMHLPVWACLTCLDMLNLSEHAFTCLGMHHDLQHTDSQHQGSSRLHNPFHSCTEVIVYIFISCTQFKVFVRSIPFPTPHVQRALHVYIFTSCTQFIKVVGSISLSTPLQFIKQIFITCTEM